MQLRCIAVDFDHTLARLDDPGYRELFAIFTARGVPLEIVELSYQAVKASNGFSLPNLLGEVSDRGFVLDEPAIRMAFDGYLGAKLHPYSDTLTAVQSWRDRHIPVVIVTAGADSYQREKVVAVKIPCDLVLVVSRVNQKTELIQALLEQYGSPLIFVDDKGSELDALRDAHLKEDAVATVRILRPDSPYYNQVPRYHHMEVTTLTDVALVDTLGATVAGG